MGRLSGIKDIHGDLVREGDTVHCWDGSKDQREVTQSLRGIVNVKGIQTGDLWRVGGNTFALSCAEHVEIINSIKKGYKDE